MQCWEKQKKAVIHGSKEATSCWTESNQTEGQRDINELRPSSRYHPQCVIERICIQSTYTTIHQSFIYIPLSNDFDVMGLRIDVINVDVQQPYPIALAPPAHHPSSEILSQSLDSFSRRQDVCSLWVPDGLLAQQFRSNDCTWRRCARRMPSNLIPEDVRRLMLSESVGS